MTSLTDAYGGDRGTVVDGRRRVAGTGLYIGGALLVVLAIVFATTDLRSAFGLGLLEGREVAGILAGIGLPAVFVGIFAVLPASRVVRAAAAIGASVALFGVTLFGYAYPDRWLSVDPLLTVSTVLVYSLGTLVTVWCMFLALATLQTRNDPGGTARMRVTEEGTIKVIEADRSLPGMGGVGLFGRDPEPTARTQTGREGAGGPTVDADGGATVIGEPTSDGGTTVEDPGEAPRSPAHPASGHGTPDRYCGNCEHFEYVKAADGMEPYCGLRGEVMDDIDACEDWSANH